MPKFGSKSELDNKKTPFSLLPAEDYQLVITELEERTQPKYMKLDEMEDVINFTLEIVGFKDGERAVDVDGKIANGRKLWFTARPNSIGFTQAGIPSITRQFVGYALGLDDIEADFELEDWNSLIGKTVYAEVITKTSATGKKVNKIARFLKPPRKKI